jgi:succinate dehydrogenase / fumarate reductase membrane anchor subunit
LFHHLHLGLEVIIEDYVHSRWVKFATLILQKFVTIIFGFGAAFAVLKIALS